MHRTFTHVLKRSIPSRPITLSSARSTCSPVYFNAQQVIGQRFNSTKASQNEQGDASSSSAATPSPKNEEQTAEHNTEQAAPEAEAENVESPELIELREKLDKKDKDLAAMKNHYTRAKADFRHLQETTKVEVEKAKNFALQKFAKDLLESVDNFDLALGHVKQETLEKNTEVKNLYDGVNMTKDVFLKTLSKFGIKKIEPLDEPFDPNLHEAVFEAPHPDKTPGTVFFVQQNGFTLNDRVLRPAKVGLVKVEE